MKTEEINQGPDSGLLLRYLNHTATFEERLLVDEWCGKDKNHEKELVQLAWLYDIQKTQQHMQQWNTRKAYDKVQQRIKNKSVRILLQRIAVAASLIFGVFGIVTLLQQHGPESIITIQTNAGMRSETTLPDGTTVCLNANTTLIYPAKYQGKERWVQLSGEAYFDVVHDEKKIFTVNTAQEKLNIHVLGTKFNVRAYPKDSIIQTTLIEGSISLEIKGHKENLLVKPLEQVGYHLVSNEVSVKSIDPEIDTAWLTGKFIFKDTPMPEALKQLGNYYSVDFEIKDDLIMEYSFTGIFENRPLSQILDYLKASSGINYVFIKPSGLTDGKNPVVVLRKQ